MDNPNDETTTLLMKNIPNQLDLNELLDKLHIPAKQIKPFGRKRALISYQLKSEAETAIETLRNLELFNKTPNVAVFCKDKPKECQETYKHAIKKTNTKSSNKAVQTKERQTTTAAPFTAQQVTKYVQKLYAIEGELNFDQPPPPYLKYNYPPINRDILDNITISLFSNKRFYTQVLHLMNRMNLEPPFNERKYKFKPPGRPKEMATQTEDMTIQQPQTPAEARVEEVPESELESSEDDERQKYSAPIVIKRKQPPPNEEQYKKKARQMLQSVQKLNKEKVKKFSQPATLTEIFETGHGQAQISKIALNLKDYKLTAASTTTTTSLNRPVHLPEELKTQQLSVDDIQNLAIYKNYQIGPASNKLYIKNLHKDVTTEDLYVLYKRFVKDQDIKLDIVVMQHGRMKGQAFVTFQGEQMETVKPLIAQALQDTNGFVLRGKPMVVCYGKQS